MPQNLTELIEEAISEMLDSANAVFREELGIDMPERELTQAQLRDHFNALADERDPVKFAQGWQESVDELGEEDAMHQLGLRVRRTMKEQANGN